jgi:hypothetical protein
VHVLRVVEVARRARVRDDRHGRGQVVREVQDIEQVRAPVAQLPGSVVPARPPPQRDQALAVGRILRGSEPQGPVEVGGRRRRILEPAVP